MGYTHGTPKDAEFRTCTCCGKTYPNTTEYFGQSKQGMDAVCKKCKSKNGKKKRELLKERFPSSYIEYEGEKTCICCGRSLLNSYKYFPVDKTTKTGLRNKCRECTPGYGKFLDDGYVFIEDWSPEEDEIIRTQYMNYTGIELHEKFLPNRTVRAIESRATTLGCSGKTDETKKRANEHKAIINSEKLKGRVISEEQKIKLSTTMKEYYKTHEPWWKGKHRSAEQVEQMRQRQIGKWAGDLNPRHLHPLNGSENGRWKGGINATYVELRTETKNWQNKSIEFCGYRCVISSGSFHNIHHTTPFRDIVDEVFENTCIDVKPQVMNYTEAEFQILRDEVNYLHGLYGLGACLNKDVHKLFHDNYGYTGFTPEDFLDFVYRIDIGEFDDWFEENNIPININYDYVEYLENIVYTMKKECDYFGGSNHEKGIEKTSVS